jgi:D-serine deaminase-like pyridoxal phosphate-dependent protein
MNKQEIPTPALVVDFDKLKQNIDEMAQRTKRAGILLRPHVKTHKTPYIAHLQMKAGAAGIVCAKLGEAEVMAAAGIEDIWICYPIVGADKIERLLNLARWVPRISTTVDTRPAARALNDAAIARGQCIPVLVEVEVGYRRTGLEPGACLLEFLREIVTDMPGLRYEGLMYIAGAIARYLERDQQLNEELRAAKIVTDSAAMLRTNGIETPVISGGTTPGAQYMHLIEGLTEYRPGCYVFSDVKYAEVGALAFDQIALTILTTVVSVPSVAEPDHFVVDAGSKMLTHTKATTIPGFGLFVGMPSVTVTRASEEHGIVQLPAGVQPPSIGAKLEIYPTYASDVTNLSDRLWVVQKDQVIATWDIAARGKSD